MYQMDMKVEIVQNQEEQEHTVQETIEHVIHHIAQEVHLEHVVNAEEVAKYHAQDQ